MAGEAPEQGGSSQGRLAASLRGALFRTVTREPLGIKLAIACGVALAIVFAALVLLTAVIGGITASASAGACSAGTDTVSPQGIPAQLVPIYSQAAAKFRLGPQGPSVLASINKTETSFGQNMATSSASAIGWMQFEPGTWASYGVDANGDGNKDPYDPEDAIFGAANYLHASGAPGDWQRAVFAYNHADWYVQQILTQASLYEQQGLAGSDTAACTEIPAGDAGQRYRALLAEADRISSKDFPYVWGGGHTQPAPDPDHTTGYDCSGAVSRLVQAAGYPYPTSATQDMEQLWKLPRRPGPVTVYLKATGPQAHVFVRIGKRFWGTSGFARPNGGAGWFRQSPSPGYLKGFAVYHLPGL